MPKLKISIDNQKLRARFLFRKLGFKSYQIHQICLPKHKLIYIPIPKNACTSIKQALHEIEFGKPFNAAVDKNKLFSEVHDYYLKRPDAFTGKEELDARSGYTRFTVVRDPVERLISCYRNRVLDLGDLSKSSTALRRKGLSSEPDLNTFVINLDQYRKISNSIEHHSRPQSVFLGGSIRYLDKIYRMKDLEALFNLLKEDKPDLTPRRRKTGGTKFGLEKLSEKAFRKLLHFYSDDYTLLTEYYSEKSTRQKFETAKKRS